MRRIWIHILLFILTVASTLVVGGPAYSIAIILILLGHEMGHYFMSQRYGIRATLPYFLPFPFSPFGTLGAVIRMEGTTSSRKSLFDTGVAGPFASLLLSIPAIAIGLRFSEVIPTSQLKEGTIRLADPLLFSFIQNLVMGEVAENHDILLHPIGYAGWVGLFVTALNLLPVGQLDGGHISRSLLGKSNHKIMSIAGIFILLLSGYFVLAIMVAFFKMRTDDSGDSPLDDVSPLSISRKLLVLVYLGMMILTISTVTLEAFPLFSGTSRALMSSSKT